MSTSPAIETVTPGTASRRQLGDPAAWRALLSSANATDFAQSWLSILCGQIDFAFGPAIGREKAVLVAFVALGEPNSQRYARTAKFGEGDVSFVLAKAAERSLQLRRAVVQSGDAPAAPCQVALPITQGEDLHGLVGIELVAEATPYLDSIMRFVQWGLGWYTRVARPRNKDVGDDTATIVAKGIDLVGQTGGSTAAVEALCTELADRFAVGRVTLGAGHAQRVKLIGTSHGGLSAASTDFAVAISTAMEEAMAAASRIVYPAPEQQSFALGAHQRLCRSHNVDWAATLPLPLPRAATRADDERMALTFEGKGAPPNAATLARWEAVAQALAPMLAWRLASERSMLVQLSDFARAEWRRLVVARDRNRRVALGVALWAVAFVLFAHGDYRISAKATLEGAVKRAIVAPFDGYILEATAHPGDRVPAGTILARLDDRDLKLQKLDLEGKLSEAQRQASEAMGDRDMANTSILMARASQAEAELNLVDQNLTRTALVAPFDAIVISGDPSQQIGAPMHRGETLYELSPLDSFSVSVDVEESDFADVQIGQEGRLLLASIPYESFPIRVTRITPLATARDGKTSFRVDAALEAKDPALRPGMQGVAKVSVGRRRYVWMWSHDLVDWVRLKLWEWIP